jgi:predicted solute-binding protein
MSSQQATSTQIARIPYLNTEPFYHRFSAQGYELVDLPPRELGREAALGRIAAGPMSAVDYFRLEEDFEPLGPFGIAAAGCRS